MKILTGIDAPFIPFGGSFLCCNDWYSNLPEDVEVRFLTLPPTDGKKWWSIKNVVMLDIAKARTPEEYPEYLAQLTKMVEAQIEDFKPDIIHAQHLNYGLSRVFADLQTDIPRLGICHGTDVQATVASPFFLENLQHICDAMDMLVFPNQSMTDDFFKVYSGQKRYVINPLGIPDIFYDKARRHQVFNGKDEMKVLYAGRLLTWKGADVAVEAMVHVKHPIHLTIIGNEDEKGYRAKLNDLVQTLQLQDQVTFCPQLPRQDLVQAFADFAAIVFPSRKLEAFSLTLVEAQTQGLPVLYAQTGGGIADTAGNAGIAFAETTPESLAQTLDTVYAQPELLQQAQTLGYENAEKYRMTNSQKRLFNLSVELIKP